MKEKLRRWLTSSYTLAAVGFVAGIAGIIIFILIGYDYKWTGFGEYVRIKANDQEEFQRMKTLWDWLQLLIVPSVLAIGGYVFNRAEKAREAARTEEQAEVERKRAEQQAQVEREIAEDNQREAALQTYFDRMSELVLDKELRDLAQDDAAWAIAQARTETTLQQLDTDRKARLVRFLSQAQLLNKQQAGIDLVGANLAGGDLKYVQLAGANLRQTNLAGANFRRANLKEADLGLTHLAGANLWQANLERTVLVGANLEGTDLRGANLKGAALRGANLEGAELKYAQLAGANFRRANLKRAGLRGADLRGVINLTHEQLQEAITDETTQLPDYLKIPSEEKAVGQSSETNAAEEQ